MNNLFIYGPPKSGKTTVAKLLAAQYKKQFFDLYQEIENRTGDSIDEIVYYIGEAGFRQVENDILDDIIYVHSDSVISLGDWTLYNKYNRRACEIDGNSVKCINIPEQQIISNFIKSNSDIAIPSCKLNEVDKFISILNDRYSHYQSFSNQLDRNFINSLS